MLSLFVADPMNMMWTTVADGSRTTSPDFTPWLLLLLPC